MFARDTPNFIANRIGVFIMLEAVRLMQEEDLTIEEVDALTGTAIGWPRTGTFRLADLVGLDVLAHVAANFRARRPARASRNPAVRQDHARTALAGRQNEAGLLQEGERRRRKGIRLALDWKTLEYRPAGKPKLRRSKWPRTPNGCRSACAICSADDYKGQSRAVPMAAAERALELRRRLPARNRR